MKVQFGTTIIFLAIVWFASNKETEIPILQPIPITIW